MIRVFSVKDIKQFSGESYIVINSSPRVSSDMRIITTSQFDKSYEAIASLGTWWDGPFSTRQEAQDYIKDKGWRRYDG